MEAFNNQQGIELRRGNRLGNYILLEYIGGGGEAQIWSVWDEQRKKIIALKIVSLLGQVIDPDSRALIEFTRQIDLIGDLDHPNILPFYESGTTQHQIYCGMRYISGGSLADRLMAGPFSLEEAIRIISQIASALIYLHNREIVHRDIKPSNILVDSQDRIYLTDFGLAKFLIQETVPLHTGRGTGPYAPFEQYALSDVTPQSDIYSLGILIYEMLTGNLPWDGQVSLARRQKEAYAVLPDPRDVRPELPPPLVDVLRQMTAFSWIERPSTVGEAFELLIEAVTDVVGDYSLDSVKPVKMDETLLDEQDAQSLLQNFLARWDLERQEFPARLTHLAFIGEYIRQEEDRGQSVSVEVYRFMLRGALTHAYQLDYWWQSLGDAQDRLQVGLQALENEDEATIARVIDVMAANVSNLPVTPGLLLGIQDRLIDLAVANQNSDLGLNALKILEFNLPKATRWQPASAPGPVDEKLAHLALGDSDLSGRAARLIGQWRNRNAVQAMLDAKAGRTRVLGALEEVKKAAGSLPDNVPLNWKWRASTRSVRRQFKEDADRFSLPRLLIGVGMGALVSIWMALGIFSSADARMRDAMLAPYPVSSIVTIVEVNDATLERFGRLDSWPRTRHAELIDDLTRDGARAIVFDIIFASQTPEDDLLAQAMRRAGDVVQPVMGQGDAYQDVKWTFRFEGRLLPDPTLSAASAAIGHTNIVHDADGYVRRMPTTIIANGQRYPSLTLAALEVYLGLNTNPGDFPEPADGWLDFAGRRIPVGKNGEMLINFAGPPAQAQGSTYQRTSYQSVLDHSENPASIKDKIILIGITATAGPDVYLTPVSQGRPMTGIEILANTIETIWSSRFIQRPSLAIRILILIGLGALVGLVSKQPGSGLLLLVGVAGTYFILANVLFDSKGILLDLLYPFLAILTSFMGVMGYRFSILRKTQNK